MEVVLLPSLSIEDSVPNSSYSDRSAAVTPLKNSNNSKSKRDRRRDKQYEIEFPTGSMGLELEPVIISSERQLGCRVKDFYFDLEYKGLDPDYLQSHVAIGDIISKINGESVISFTFDAILNKLRQLKFEKRVVGFKNITASGTIALNSIFLIHRFITFCISQVLQASIRQTLLHRHRQ